LRGGLGMRAKQGGERASQVSKGKAVPCDCLSGGGPAVALAQRNQLFNTTSSGVLRSLVEYECPTLVQPGTASPSTHMKNILKLASILVAFGWSAQAADTSVKLSKVHLCCNGCVKGVDKALTGVSGAKAQS